jgi:hypothetical protein
MAIHVPIYTPGEIIDATRKCLADNHVPDTIPIPIEEIVDVAYRIDLVPTPRLEERFSTVAFITHDLTGERGTLLLMPERRREGAGERGTGERGTLLLMPERRREGEQGMRVKTECPKW